jgi:hypothetical protein
MTVMPFAFGWRQAPLLTLLLGAVLTAACGEDEYKFVPDEPEDAGIDQDSGPPPPSTPTVCSSDADCAGLPATTVCDMRSGYCVECIPEQESTLDRCPAGTYCQADNRCGVGCADDADCLGLTCEPATHTCRGCTSDANCAPGTICSGAVCVPGCAANETCPTGYPCCGGLCKNVNSDRTSCGACDAACAETGQCINGVCGPGPCEPGLGECNANPEDGCETDLISNPLNCGRCRAVCASGLCSGGMCTSTECPDGYADCNQREEDLCEASLSTVEHCQTCGKECNADNGVPSCTSNGCAIACDDGFGDCDEDADTGCEVDLMDDPDNCGACGTVCENENGNTRCVDGECVPSCSSGWDDCDGDPQNGCETDLGASLDDCGACGEGCDPPNATGTCVDGVCEAACAEGFADCNGRIDDGCEADLSSPETCGDCNKVCSANGGVPVCNDDKSCGITCNPGSADCINGILDGCETNTNVSTVHCGMCGRMCPSAVGVPACNDGVCGVSTCIDPNRECDGNDATVCETNVTNDAEHCGGCGMACFYPNGTGICVNRGCVLDSCDTGFADCNAALGCETALGTLDNCRTCGETCTNYHGATSCESNGCVPNCQIGWGDCDGNRNNGCETELDTLVNCGACGRSCSTPHGVPSCATGSCEITTCDAGWDDCDNSPTNGCERPLNTLSDCGGCGVMCNLPHASESCGTGTCTLTACDSGWRDCSTQAGCETQLGTLTDCLGCGDACLNTHATTSCNPTTGCQPVCDTGWKSCDGNRGNGCERNIRTLTDCGDCDVDCNLANAAESCSSGTCTLGTCSTGFGNCDMNAATGCETPLGTLSNCLSCGNSCANPHGSTSCMGASGCQYMCSTGWDNCDANAANGCETSIWSLTDCGQCGRICDEPNSNETCGGGTCTATTCAMGFAECVAGAPACETPLGTTANCRSCNETCTNPHGTTTCSMTNGCTPVCAAGWKSCDNIADNGCERDIRTLTSCGDCDVPCSRLNATASCSTGTCTFGTCNAGFDSCDGQTGNGCETQLGTPSNCAACANACTNAHGTNGCTGMPGTYDCSPTCDTGWGTCNMNPDDGCETSLTTLTNCGGCGQSCSRANASVSCTTGTCAMTGCNAGFDSCDGNTNNGCETTLGTTTNCAACANACTNTNGTTSCGTVMGTLDCIPVCSTNFRSCDGNPDNGCETSTTTLTDCGACGTPCALANAAETCPNGVCTLGMCTAGFGNCDGTPGNGCETNFTNNDNHCGACGRTCTNSNGTTDCVGTACVPVCNQNFGNCDGEPWDGCETPLSTTTNCGGCNVACGGATPFCVQGTGGTYSCAAQVNIVYVADTDHSTGSLSSSFTHNLVTAANQNRLVLLAMAQNGNAGSSVPEIVSFGGVQMLQYGTLFGNNQAFVSYWYLVDNQLGGVGDKTVLINATGGQDNPTQIRANLLEFRGVNQSQPINVAVTANNGNCGSGQHPIHSITTTTAGSFLVDLAAAYLNGGTTATPSGSLTQTMSYVSSSPLGAMAGYRGPLAVGTYTVGWTVGACNNSSHYIIALRPP